MIYKLNPEAPPFEPLVNSSDEGTGYVPEEVETDPLDAGEAESQKSVDSTGQELETSGGGGSSYSDVRSDNTASSCTDSEWETCKKQESTQDIDV